jgi:tetratricopeptide (TPR) repeat protein
MGGRRFLDRKGGWLVTAVVGLLIMSLAAPADARRKKKKKDKKKAPIEEAVPEEEPPPPPEEPPAPPPPPAPWAEGVSTAQQDLAQQLLGEGNDLFLVNKYKEAAAKYEEAVKSWDHPAIRFNLVRALINLGRPVEANANLKLALRYGKDPLQEHVYAEALMYQKLLLGQIAKLEVTCDEAGAKVTLDGQTLMECPGKETRMLTPGSHQVVAEKASYLTFTKEMVLLGGKDSTMAVEMVSMQDASIQVRRWKSWKPWAVAGGGFLVAGIGGLLQLKAKSDFDTYGEDIAASCGDRGCYPEDISQTVKNLESTARLENRVAIGAFIAGGALVVTGVVMLIMNSPKTVVPDDLAATKKGEKSTLIVPTVSPSGDAGLSVLMRF